MSVEVGSSTRAVFVRLLGEGTVVYRAAQAAMVSEDSARLLRPADYDDDDEDWEFKPGSLVRLEARRLEGKVVPVAVAIIADAS